MGDSANIGGSSPPPAHTVSAPWQIAATTGAEGFLTDISGLVHWVRWGSPDAAPRLPPILFIHGLGGSHLDWTELGPLLAEERVAYALDLRGFGLSAGARPSDSEVEASARLISRFVDAVIGRPVRVVAHAMGGLVAALTVHTYPTRIHSLVLVSPTLPHWGTRAGPGIGREHAWFSPTGVAERISGQGHAHASAQVTVQNVLDRTFVDPERATGEMVNRAAELLRTRKAQPETFGDLDQAYFAAARSVHRMLRGRRGVAAMLREIDAPVLIVHGRADRIVPTQASRAVAERHLHWTYVELPRSGLAPHLEDAGLLADIIDDWWAAGSAL